MAALDFKNLSVTFYNDNTVSKNVPLMKHLKKASPLQKGPLACQPPDSAIHRVCPQRGGCASPLSSPERVLCQRLPDPSDPRGQMTLEDDPRCPWLVPDTLSLCLQRRLFVATCLSFSGFTRLSRLLAGTAVLRLKINVRDV